MISQKHIKDSERKYVNIMCESRNFAQRIAGSGCGKYSVCDLIVVQKGEVYLTEVKSTSAKELRLTKDDIAQIKHMVRRSLENPPLKAMLVIHWKRRGWQQIQLEPEIDCLQQVYKFKKRREAI